LKTFAFVFGIIFLFIGIAGFIPAVTVDNQLFGLFHTNVWLSSLHILTGTIAAIAASFGTQPAQIFFQIAGIVYTLLALLGFIYEDEKILGLFASNSQVAWFHVITATIALIAGYGAKG
jgi:hypothetical protein